MQALLPEVVGTGVRQKKVAGRRERGVPVDSLAASGPELETTSKQARASRKLPLHAVCHDGAASEPLMAAHCPRARPTRSMKGANRSARQSAR